MTKLELLQRGAHLVQVFCARNSLPAPHVNDVATPGWSFGVCAYYRPTTIQICVPKCAAIGVAGPAWSFPGYTVDRTPYGVLQHELGHHVDVLKGNRKGAYWSDFSAVVRGLSGEKQITSYCPNDAEWFAEMFRVFVTNPDLLRLVRPRTYSQLLRAGLKPVFEDTWRDRLAGAPERTVTAAGRHIEREASLV
jgi:hypothetical protein